jgi:RNA polymerase sigma factor (sigma-70 family)
MARQTLAGVLRYVRHLVRPGGDDEQSDGQLLRRFVARREEAAFAELLRRHGPLVLGVCRQVLRNEHDAEDVFQATFLVLARKAASIRSREALPAWLYRVALNLARTVRTSAARRRVCERQVAAMSRVSSVEEDPDDWQPLLHEAVDRLPKKYRVPVVLCYLEGKTNEEAARALGWPVGTVKGRLARARALLHTRLARGGLALPAAGLTAVLTPGAIRAAVPATVAESTLHAALQFAAGPVVSAAWASAETVRLARGAVRAGALTRLIFVVCFVAAVAAGTGGALCALYTREEAPPAARPVAEAGQPPGPAPVPARDEVAPAVRQRIVFVGDSSTDGHTYLLLIRQALAGAGHPVPRCVNAGVSVDTARGVRQRLERDVFVHRPTLVAFSTGVHDALQSVTPAEYEADVRAIANRLRAEGIPLLLVTPGLLGPGYAAAESRLEEYNAVLHRLAGEFGCRLADAHRLLREARAAGRAVVEGDNTNPTYEGQRLIARAVLDALGHGDVPVPRELVVRPLPGILKEWRLRVAPRGQPDLDEPPVAALEPGAPGWTTYTLPEPGPAPTWWFEQERQRGFAVSLDKRLGKALLYQGVAYLPADRPRAAFLHTGGEIKGVWLNGERVYRNRGWTGWHAGKERLPVRLRAGQNVLVIETGTAFFLSVTDDPETPDEG